MTEYKFLFQVSCIPGHRGHQWPAKDSTHCRFCGRHIKWVEGKGYVIKKARVSDMENQALAKEEKMKKNMGRIEDELRGKDSIYSGDDPHSWIICNKCGEKTFWTQMVAPKRKTLGEGICVRCFLRA